jgi:hypothetical protein
MVRQQTALAHYYFVRLHVIAIGPALQPFRSPMTLPSSRVVVSSEQFEFQASRGGIYMLKHHQAVAAPKTMQPPMNINAHHVSPASSSCSWGPVIPARIPYEDGKFGKSLDMERSRWVDLAERDDRT